MNTNLIRHWAVIGSAMAGAVLFAACAETAQINGQPRAGSSQSEVAAAAASEPSTPEAKTKESVRPPVKPVPVESKTPEDAALRAADPKDPSGALIVLPPAGKDTPRKPE
jgi:hypothetical protein